MIKGDRVLFEVGNNALETVMVSVVGTFFG